MGATKRASGDSDAPRATSDSANNVHPILSATSASMNRRDCSLQPTRLNALGTKKADILIEEKLHATRLGSIDTPETVEWKTDEPSKNRTPIDVRTTTKKPGFYPSSLTSAVSGSRHVERTIPGWGGFNKGGTSQINGTIRSSTEHCRPNSVYGIGNADRPGSLVVDSNRR